MPGEGPLAGVHVLEVGELVSAPFAAKLLADYGADVLKIEPPGGDRARNAAPPSASGLLSASAGAGERGARNKDRNDSFVGSALRAPRSALELSPLFLYLNTNKRSLVLDLSTAAGQVAFRELAEGADLVIENLAPGMMADWGLGYEALAQRNPRLTMVSLSPFGQDGPYARYPASNLTTFALGGQMAVTGDPHREPLKNAGYQADYQLGLNGFAAAAIALYGARLTGAGQHVDVSALECMASVLEATLNTYSYTGRYLGSRRGNVRSATIALYECADGWLGVHAMPRNLPFLLELVGMSELLEDERFRTPAARLQHNDELSALFMAWAVDQHKKDVYDRAGPMRGPVAYAHSLQDLRDSPQLAARGYWHEVDHPVAGRLTYPGAPILMSDSPWRAGRAPLLGEGGNEQWAVESGPLPGPSGHPLPQAGEGLRPSGAGAAPQLRAPDIELEVHPPTRRLSGQTPLPRAGEGAERSEAGEGPPPLPLSDVRVLDLTMVWAGPYGTRILADMGAEVIKIEATGFYDQLRNLGLLPPGTELAWNKAAYFNHNNRNKLGCTIDLTTEDGKRLFLDLLKTADVVVENYRAEVMDRLGLGYETLRAVRPDIILVSMPGHGKTGPERDYVAYGTNIEQLSGLVALTGYEDGVPRGTGISYGDPMSGIAMAGAVAMALLHRERTGRGQYVELAQREVLTSVIGEYVVAHSMTGEQPAPIGNRHPTHAPHNVYPTRSAERGARDSGEHEATGNGGSEGKRQDDGRAMSPPDASGAAEDAGERTVRNWGDEPDSAFRVPRSAFDEPWVTIACTSDAQFAALCRVMERPELAGDPRFASEADRHTHQGELDAIIGAWTAGLDKLAVFERLTAAGVPCGPVLAVPELMVDPHLRARGFFESVTHPDAGTWDMEGPVYRLSRTPAHIRLNAPRFGEHNAWVTGHLLGRSAEEYDSLLRAGIMGDTPNMAVHQ